MIRATTGSRLYVGATPCWGDGFMQPDVYDVADWVQVGRLEALGSVGQSWAMDEIGMMTHEPEPVRMPMKAARRGGSMQVVMGLEEDDTGQIALLAAFRDTEPYPFRLVFTGEDAPERRWTALVTDISEQFDDASSVMKLVADLALTSAVIRI